MRTYWLIFFLMLPHMKPKCVNYLFPEYRLVFEALRVVSLLVVTALFIRAFVKEKKLPSPPTWVLGFLEVWICLITLLNDGDFVQVCSLAVAVMSITLLVDLFADTPRQLISALMLNFEWSVYANLYTVLKWPEEGFVVDPDYGNMPIYFFGPDNWFMYLCIPAVCVALLYLRFQWNTKGWTWKKIAGIIRAGALIAAAYACVYIMWPATAVVALTVFAAVMLITLIPGVRYCVSYPVVLVSGITANLAIAVLRVMDTVPAITDFIVNTLHKDTTLSWRTFAWKTCPKLLEGNFLTGLGVPKEGYIVATPVCEFQPYDHMHNIIFDMLVQGGIPALVLFSTALVLVGIPLTRYAKKPSSQIMTAAMAALLVICIPEVCRHGLIYLLFPLAWHVGRFENILHQPSIEGTLQ